MERNSMHLLKISTAMGCIWPGTVHLSQEVSDSPHLAATWEARGWQQVGVVSFEVPAQPIEVQSWSSLQPKAVSQRDLLSWLLEKARGHSLRRRVGWIWSSYEEVHRTFVSIVKALKVLTSGTHGMVQVSWTDGLSGLMPNFSLQKWSEGNHSMQELMTLKTQTGIPKLGWGNTRSQRGWTWVWIWEVGKWGRNYPFNFFFIAYWVYMKILWGTFTTPFQIWIDLRDCAILNVLLLFFLLLPQLYTNLLKFEKQIADLVGCSSWEPCMSVWKALMRLFWNPAAWLLLQNPLSKENCASFAQSETSLPLVRIALHSLVQYCCGTSADLICVSFCLWPAGGQAHLATCVWGLETSLETALKVTHDNKFCYSCRRTVFLF